VLTGGQSGADRAATDAALACGIAYGGWVPRGGWAEDFPTPPGVLVAYPDFTESPSEDLAVRTVRNVDDADGLLVVWIAPGTSRGSDLALGRAVQLGKPLATIDVRSDEAGSQLEALLARLGPHCTLNIAGPRESEQPGIYAAARRFFEANLGLVR
jgi:hypothetical protein